MPHRDPVTPLPPPRGGCGDAGQSGGFLLSQMRVTQEGPSFQPYPTERSRGDMTPEEMAGR